MTDTRTQAEASGAPSRPLLVMLLAFHLRLGTARVPLGTAFVKNGH